MQKGGLKNLILKIINQAWINDLERRMIIKVHGEAYYTLLGESDRVEALRMCRGGDAYEVLDVGLMEMKSIMGAIKKYQGDLFDGRENSKDLAPGEVNVSDNS